MDADGATDERASLRTAKPCGPDAPTLASSWRKRFHRRWWQQSPVTRESAEETVKTIACGNAGRSGVPVATNSHAFFTACEAAGAAGTRHSPRPDFRWRETLSHHPGISCRGIAEVWLFFLSRGAQQNPLSF